jgi:hypothetical protein
MKTILLIVLFSVTGLADSNPDKALQALARVESSNCKNKNHTRIESGPSRGQTASGCFGLLPTTILWLIETTPSLKRKYSDLLSMTWDEVTSHINANYATDREISKALWLRLRATMDKNRAALSWYAGPAFTKNITSTEAERYPYVQRFLAAYPD